MGEHYSHVLNGGVSPAIRVSDVEAGSDAKNPLRGHFCLKFGMVDGRRSAATGRGEHAHYTCFILATGNNSRSSQVVSSSGDVPKIDLRLKEDSTN